MKELKIARLKEGTVIDHIKSENTFRVARILGLENSSSMVTIGANLDSTKMGRKGLIKIENKFLNEKEANKIALVAPEANLCIIRNSQVEKKIRLEVPDELRGLARCINTNCVTNHEKAETRFIVESKEPLKLRCHYCERIFGKGDLEIL
ncbi:MAG: aspartate carbamoyltransferase regulatory subunit [Candidatus Aenigmarchaeota archaeon]|nr:aspartate carbamoyltransferase regulatory subunit [Candidatus Aenigmarchaeota archaeon]